MSKVTEVTHAIMRAFFDREPDENGNRVFTASPSDNEDLAIAAITAMHEPTPEMIKAGTIGWDPMDGGPIKPMFDPTEPYTAMIDEALK